MFPRSSTEDPANPFHVLRSVGIRIRQLTGHHDRTTALTRAVSRSEKCVNPGEQIRTIKRPLCCHSGPGLINIWPILFANWCSIKTRQFANLLLRNWPTTKPDVAAGPPEVGSGRGNQLRRTSFYSGPRPRSGTKHREKWHNKVDRTIHFTNNISFNYKKNYQVLPSY